MYAGIEYFLSLTSIVLLILLILTSSSAQSDRFDDDDTPPILLPDYIDHGAYLKLNVLADAVNVPINLVVDADWNLLNNVNHQGNVCPFRRAVLSKLLNNETIKIVVVGGSMTYGAGLSNRDRERDRWSDKFSRYMNSDGWCNSKIEVDNIAIPATNVDVWIEQIRFTTAAAADLVIVDEQVNDQVFDLKALPHLYHTFISIIDNLPNHPAILFSQTFITAGSAFQDINKKCYRPGAWGACCEGYYWCKTMWEMQDFTEVALQHFEVPYISYRDMFWPDYYNDSHVRQYWNGGSHPDIKTHNM
jgi:hypothetical protein